MRRVFFTSILILLFLGLGTAAGIFYAKGYRIIPNNNGTTKVAGTGLLVTTSKPDAAKVLVNGQLKTATNNTINLTPGEYDVTIEKDGYFPWKKKISIKKEVVSRADALLLPSAPKLENITNTGASKAILDPTRSLIAYTISSSSALKNGIYVIDMNANYLFPGWDISNQIANDLVFRFSSAQLEFSPDGKDLIASLSGQLRASAFLLASRELNTNPQNVTTFLNQVKTNWNDTYQENMDKLIKSEDEILAQIIQQNFTNISFSPDHNKILYEASQSATLPVVIKPRLVGVNSTPETREIEKGNTYIYDVKEDRNYVFFSPSALPSGSKPPQFLWYPDSSHLIFIKDKKVNIVEYDGQNLTSVYAGPFVDDFVAPWPDGSSIVILTNLNLDEAPHNLYRLSLK